MESLLITGLVLLGVLVPIPVQSTAIPLVPLKMPVVETSTTEWIKERILHYANLYGVSEITMNIAIKCESNYNPQAVGDGGLSHGLVQIHAPAHPSITYEQMHDVDFSLDFLAKNLKAGKKNMWTCLKNN